MWHMWGGVCVKGLCVYICVCGVWGGAQTHNPEIKSRMLYRLSQPVPMFLIRSGKPKHVNLSRITQTLCCRIIMSSSHFVQQAALFKPDSLVHSAKLYWVPDFMCHTLF